jgi:hypothetical protein
MLQNIKSTYHNFFQAMLLAASHSAIQIFGELVGVYCSVIFLSSPASHKTHYD